MIHRAALQFALAVGGLSPPESPPPGVARAELARAYLQVESALADTQADGAVIAEANRRFDAATLTFFSGGYGVAIEQLHEAARLLRGDDLSTAPNAALSLMVRPVQPVIPQSAWQAERAGVAVRVTGMYELRDEQEKEHHFRLTVRRSENPSAEPVAQAEFRMTLGAGLLADEIISVPVNPDSAPPPGLYDLLLDDLGDGNAPVEAGTLQIVRQSLDALRVANTARLEIVAERVRADDGRRDLKSAMASVAARNDLLSDTPSSLRSAQFMVDLAALSESVAAEIAALERGQNPFAGRAGDWWRVLPGGRSGPLPFRLYVPEVVGDNPPLIIALHGAGGDENMFMDAYGMGQIRRLADRHKFVVVAPLAYQFVGNARAFDALIALVAGERAIDRDRIYVIGHSMGAAGAWSLAVQRAEAVAAVACLAGGGGGPQMNEAAGLMAPTLVIGAELDPVIPAARLESGAGAAQASGCNVVYRVSPGYGHTLMVNRELAGAVEWLLARRREPERGTPGLIDR